MNAAAIPKFTVAAFEDGTLDVDAFDHEAHIYVAWLYLEELPLPDAIARFCAVLKKLTTKLGVAGKYHETITWFFMILIAERRQHAASSDWFSFRRANGDLFDRSDSIIDRYYSKDLLGSEQARESFVLPDKLVD